MNLGEVLTRTTIWISILSYALGYAIFATTRRYDQWVRVVWTIGCLALLAHFAAAFNYYHAWSQASAYSETARQTAEVIRINWGGGLFINYAVALFWIVDVGWWWLAGVNSYRRRAWLVTTIWHGFLIFIIFNATVVFKSGLTRWIGLLICLSLCWNWIQLTTNRRVTAQPRNIK